MILQKAKLNALIIISLAFLFPVIALLNYALNIQSSTISICYRLFNLFIAALVILNFRTKKFLTVKFFLVLFFLFWLFFLTRLVIDVEYYNIHLAVNYPKSYYFLYAFFVTFIPMTAVFFLKQFDFNYFLRVLLKVLKFINIFLLAIYLYDILLKHEFMYRFALIRNNFEYLNPISIGDNAAMLILLIIYTKARTLSDKIFLLIGTILLIVTGSRGPLLSVFIVILLIFIFNTKLLFKNNHDFVIKILIVSTLIVLLLLKYNFTVFTRIGHFQSDESTMIRSSILSNAFTQYSNSPLVGSHFLVQASNNFTHNIIFDIFLATGIIGFILFFPSLWIFIKIIIQNRLKMAITSLTLYIFFDSLLSGTIFLSYTFWILFVVIIINRSFLIKSTAPLISNQI